MKISLAWLNEYLDKPVTADEVERLLTAQGMPIESRKEAGNGDIMLDVEVTSNRADCLSHVGVAREIAAGSPGSPGSGRTLKSPDCRAPLDAIAGPSVDELTKITNERADLCPLYTARVIRGVKVGPSPAGMVRRLEAVGLRSVSNVVDVTNFILLELGQPLHAFDLGKLGEQRVVVRTARPGESFDAIDSSKHKLSGDMLVIADAAKPVAIAGVMGGLASEVTAATTDILLESAIFDPLSVRRTSRALKLSSDSSYRFERGVDPRNVEAASERAAGLIAELAGGKIAPGVIRVGPSEPEPLVVSMRVDRCNQLLGLHLPPGEIEAIFSRLGFAPKHESNGKIIACSVPTFRLDLRREIDLIEEVARMHGIDNVPVRQKINIVARPVQDSVRARRTLGETLAAHGCHETINFSFIAPRFGEPFLLPGERPLLIDDERRKNEPMLRPSLLPSLMACRKHNQDVGNGDVRLYETGATWSRTTERALERRRLSILADALDAQQAIRELRGTIEELMILLAGELAVTFEPVERACFASGGGAAIRADGRELGTMGVVAPGTQKLFDLTTPVVAAEMDLDALLAFYPPKRSVRPLPRFPGIERDVSVVVDEGVPWDRLRAEAEAVKPAMLEELRFLVTYRGKPIPKGKKSVSFRMTFRDPAATMRHEQADGQVAAVVERLKAKLGAELRA